MSEIIEENSRESHSTKSVWAAGSVLNELQHRKQGIDFLIDDEIKVQAGLILLRNYKKLELNYEDSVSMVSILSTYIHERFMSERALVIAPWFDLPDPQVAQESPVWDEVYTDSFRTRAGTAEEIIRTVDLYSTSSGWYDTERQKIVETGSTAWFELQQEVFTHEKEVA